jgi:hypothetical protein
LAFVGNFSTRIRRQGVKLKGWAVGVKSSKFIVRRETKDV